MSQRREDTKGQACHICTQALHWKTKEGLVRGARVGDGGICARVGLAEQAKILWEERSKPFGRTQGIGGSVQPV